MIKVGDRVRFNPAAIERLTTSGRKFTKAAGTVESVKGPDQMGKQSCMVKFDDLEQLERVSSTYLWAAT